MVPAADATSSDAAVLCLLDFLLSSLVVGCDWRNRTQGLAIHTSAGIWVPVQVVQACKVDKSCSVTAWQMLSDSEEVRRASRLLSASVSSQIQALLLDPQYISVLEADLNKTPPQFFWSLRLWKDNVLSQILHHFEHEWSTTLAQFGQCHLLGLGKMTQTFQRLIGERPGMAQSLKWTCLLCLHSSQGTMYHSLLCLTSGSVSKEFQTARLLCSLFEREPFRTESGQILADSMLTIPGSLRLAGKISFVLSWSTLGKRCTSRHETQLEWHCPCLAPTWADRNKRTWTCWNSANKGHILRKKGQEGEGRRHSSHFRSQSLEANHPSLPRSITTRVSNSPEPLVKRCILVEVLRLDGCQALQGFARLCKALHGSMKWGFKLF